PLAPPIDLWYPSSCSLPDSWGCEARLLLQRDAGLARALPGARIGARALAADRQPAAMTHAAVAAEIHQPLDRHRVLATQVALDGDPADRIANPLELRVVQVLDLLVERNVRRFADL